MSTGKRVVDLSTVSCHTPERTRESAETFNGIARYLYYATGPTSGGLAEPADIYSLLAEMAEAAARFVGVSEQLRLWMKARQEAGVLLVDEGQDTDVRTVVELFDASLKRATLNAVGLSQELAQAQNNITHLAGKAI